MRIESEDFNQEVSGTTIGDCLEVHAWRGGELVASGLETSVWSLDWDAGRQVQGQATITVADPDGRLAPWGMSDALGPGGSRLQITWVSGISGTRVPLGWWRIRRPKPEETWLAYNVGSGASVRVAGGGSVTIQADEETSTAQLDRLDAEVVTAATCVAEVRRLLRDICPVVALPGVIDRPAPASLVYDDGRLNAVDDLLSVIDAAHRMGPDGAMEIVPDAGIGPVWMLAGGDDGVLIQLGRSLSDDGVYNAAVSAGKTAAGLPLVGRAYLSTGPLAWGGPYGRVPIFHQAIATTQAGVNADAATLLANRRASGEIDLPVTCLTHPGLQLHDRVIVVAATIAGDIPLEGRVVAMRMTSATSDAGTIPAKKMTLSVRVSTEALEAVAAQVHRG